MNNPYLQAQQECTNTDNNICKNCSFSINCERKYFLSQSSKEYFIETNNSIILFTSSEKYLEFCNEYQCSLNLRKEEFNKILSKSQELNKEIISYP